MEFATVTFNKVHVLRVDPGEYENPYCVAELPAERMEIRFGDQAMRLSFEL